MEKETLFKQYENLVYKRSNYYCKRYNLNDYEDVASQGFLLMAEAFEEYDEKKGSFSTFLWNKLKNLNYYCKKQCKGDDVEHIDYIENLNVPSIDYKQEYNELIEYGKKYLSDNAFKLLKWIINGEYKRKYHTQLTLQEVAKFLNLTRYSAEKYMNELRAFAVNY